jgi:serine-type D-Ala-D-Ala carboxypeptidase/endopeptidase (penicillin-binding protein 4)
MIKLGIMKLPGYSMFFFFLMTFTLTAQPGYEKVFRKLLEQPEYANAQASICLSDVESGKVLFEMNSSKLMVPASVLKLITSATALEILGSDYRFQTRIGYTGKIEKGILKGNLIIIGGGDPALGSEYFQEHYFSPHFLEVWAKKIKAAGISRVEGNLVLDGTLYDDEKIPPTWIWEDIGNYYGAGTSALTVYDNLSRISFRSPPEAGKPAEIISVNPIIEGLEWRSEVLASEINRDLAYVFGSPEDNRRIIRGTIPKNRRSFTIKASNPYPEKLLASDFLKFLALNGVFVSGKPVFEKTHMAFFQQLLVYDSPDLSEIVKVLNRESINLFAEHLVKQLAAEKTGLGSRKEGLRIITEYWKSKGLGTDQLFMEDGSGLSHFNAVSSAFVSSVLRYMAMSGTCTPSFGDMLPTAGSGTLRLLNSQHFPGNTLQIKSGSMTRIRSFSGYINTEEGKRLILTVFFNHFSGTQAKLINELEKLFLELRVMK